MCFDNVSSHIILGFICYCAPFDVEHVYNYVYFHVLEVQNFWKFASMHQTMKQETYVHAGCPVVETTSVFLFFKLALGYNLMKTDLTKL